MSRVNPSDRVECSIHHAQRPSRFLEQLTPGVWSCNPKDPCRVKPVPAEGDPIAPKATDTCDLCNADIHEGTTIDAHIVACHGTLLKYCNSLVDQAQRMEAATLHAKCISDLGHQVVALASHSDPGRSVFHHAVDARDQLEVILQTKFPKCLVYTFGSCVASGCWDGRGDVDFTLVDPAGWDNGTWPVDEASIVSKATRCLRDAGFKYDELQPLLRTRVPIVKHQITEPIDPDMLHNFANRTIRYEIQGNITDKDKAVAVGSFSASCKCHWERHGNRPRLIVTFPTCADALKDYMSPVSLMLSSKLKCAKKWYRYGYRPSIFSIQFDLSTRGFGVRNSFLLRAYLAQSAEARCGSVFIKHWSKHSGVNYSMKGYITSYAVNLMWIYYLIVKGKVTFVDPQSILPSMHDKRNFDYLPMLPGRGADQEFERRVGELVANFFRFYALEFDWKHSVVTVSRAELTTKESLSWTEENEVRSLVFRERVWHRFCIEDPFEENLNLARHVSPIKLNKVRMEFLRSYDAVLSRTGGRIMLDRSASASKAVCVRLVHRALAGEQSLPLSEVLQAIAQHDEESLAAFEVENSTHSIIQSAGLLLSNDRVSIPPDPSGALHIPKSALPKIKQIDAVLAAAPKLGASVTDEFRKCNLHHIYFYDEKTNRYFVCERDARDLREYFKIVKRAVAAFHDNESQEPAEADLRTLLGQAQIVVDEALFEVAKAELGKMVAEAYLSKLSVAHPDMMVSSKMVGKCDQCRTNGVNIWQSSDPADKGWFCQPCWEAY